MRLEPRGFVRTAALSVLCLSAAATAAAQRAVVEGSGSRVTVACKPTGVTVQGLGNTVTLTGACDDVVVEGSDNTVHIATLGRLKVAGMNNKVYWSAGIDGATPRVTKEGFGNTVEQKTPADSDAPATTTKPQTAAAGSSGSGSGSGTARATASTPTSSATASASSGNPTLTVGSGDKKVAMGAGAGGASASAKRSDPAPAQPAARSSSARSSSAAAATGSGLPILMPDNGQVKTMDCEGRAVSVQGNNNRLTLRGRCGAVAVGGNDNILSVGSTTRIDTNGNRNVVKYRELVDDKTPVITGGGTGNRVSRADPQ